MRRVAWFLAGLALAVGLEVGAQRVSTGFAIPVDISTIQTLTQTTASATAHVIGPNGTTNPVWQVDASTGSQAAGMKLTGAAAAGPVVFQATSSGSNSGITLAAKGNGTLLLSTTGTIEANSTLQADTIIQAGTNGSTTGRIDLKGSTSGTLSLTPAAAAGTYNFILPITAGSSGNLLQSGGGGATAMTWNTGKTAQTFTATYDPASLAAGVARCDNVTVTGITTTGGAVTANIGAVDPATWCTMTSARASATDTVRVCWQNMNSVATACDTASSTWVFSQAQ